MPRPKKSKAEDLVRVRDNQRKCRERRRKYIAELEQKVKSYEKETLQSSAELQTTTREELLHENEVLKRLITSSGISETCQYQNPTKGLNSPSKNGVGISDQTQNPWLLNLGPETFQEGVLAKEPSNTLNNLDDYSLMLDKSNELDKPIAHGLDLPGLTPSTHEEAVYVPSHFPAKSPFWASLDTTVLDPTVHSDAQYEPYFTPWPVLTDEMATEDRTMLCSVAYRLILQFNKKQYNDYELDLRARCGFRLGRSPLEGCRIDIEVLFAVLAEISS